ncbi:MAG: class I SAM-dependent methyltransferase [Defluviitaleaceae bacterium]|nr:class I SAM-dependent methyltransferase [Defluviitaleaceae bacterium]
MFIDCFNRDYDMYDFPHFVPREELAYNVDYAEDMVREQWIYHRWRADIEQGSLMQSGRFKAEAQKIAGHGGMILEICAGPGGGFMPAILLQDYNANIMISDLCPTVVREWQRLFNDMDTPPPNVEYAAFNTCDMPFRDNSLDVICGSAAIINIEGGGDSRDRALREVYRVLKPDGLFVFDYDFVTK